jgi:hypothetical protein
MLEKERLDSLEDISEIVYVSHAAVVMLGLLELVREAPLAAVVELEAHIATFNVGTAIKILVFSSTCAF